MTPSDPNVEDQSPQKRWFTRRLEIWLWALAATLLFSATAYVTSSPTLRLAARMNGTAQFALREYSEKFPVDSLFENAAREVYGSLDRYSGYVSVEQFEHINEEFSGRYAGIGVSVIGLDSGLLVGSVADEGPARLAGILLGDVILRADSVSLIGIPADAATQYLRGPAESPVRLIIARGGRNSTPAALGALAAPETLTVSVTRGEIPLNHVPFAGLTADSVVYINVRDFQVGATEQVTRVYDSLAKETRPRGVIIDLRGNPGGVLQEAIRMADLFLEEGTLIVGQKGRSRWSRREYYSEEGDISAGLPVIVLIDRGSASASEIFAGALAYAKRATLVGDTTYGKGLVQEYWRFFDGSASRLTVSRYYFTGEVYLNGAHAAENDTGLGVAPQVYRSFEGPALLRAFDGRLALLRFACGHDSAIVWAHEAEAPAVRLELSQQLLAEFTAYCEKQEFGWRSSLEERADELALMAEVYLADPRPVALAHEIRNAAERTAGNPIAERWSEIFPRLAEYAIERLHGRRVAFQRARLPYDPDIRFCADELRKLPPHSAGVTQARNE